MSFFSMLLSPVNKNMSRIMLTKLPQIYAQIRHISNNTIFAQSSGI